MSQKAGPGGSGRKRGHQHHPRNEGSRRKALLEQELKISKQPLSEYSQQTVITSSPNVIQSASSSNLISDIESTNVCDNLVIDLTNSEDELSSIPSSKETSPQIGPQSQHSKTLKNEQNKRIRRTKKLPEYDSEKEDMSSIYRPEAEGSSLSDDDKDPELEELSKLRCTSERTEVIAERENRRRRRCADYPGLAFSSIFSSDTLMKFSIIRNELHNIMKTQLKRVCLTRYP
ncbi:hypothetical protein WA026_007293 [Henosepilachna vigintioctopunctata]|uniref:Uncharacterized protein n=1 Tax=Henosepilachna vigintioctopunctata TaxID=420089 RepID=A0AAW1UMZ3_9CUCU